VGVTFGVAEASGTALDITVQTAAADTIPLGVSEGTLAAEPVSVAIDVPQGVVAARAFDDDAAHVADGVPLR
jgi:hypothetical protein